MAVFTRFLQIELPASLAADAQRKSPAFEVTIRADGEIPFPQVVVRDHGRENLVNGEAIRPVPGHAEGVTYIARVPAGAASPGVAVVQVEGCTTADIAHSGGGDWIKEFRDVEVKAPPRAKAPKPAKAKAAAKGTEVTLYFGIHKHMHQPYYNTTDRFYWDGEKESIFGSRGGNYTDFVPAAVGQYATGGLAHGGLSTSWSGTLIEQLDRCADDGLCGGRFLGWSNALRDIARSKTTLGNPRCDFTAFGFFHPLMALIPHRNIVKHVDWHRRIVRAAFGVDASPVMFPPETAFHVRMIPALVEAGIEAVIYDSIHRFRACRDYPYAGINEGMLPPNPAEQTNDPVDDWLQLHNIWAGSKIAPSLLRPEAVAYEDPDGTLHTIVGVPAERYIGNEDARGGFGALQYPDVLGQVYDRIVETGTFDPEHPPFFVLHSDGDNHGGGADSYYHHNTAQLVQWLNEDPRFELTGIRDYLDRFPPDRSAPAHVEPGSWAGADNGDPQFMKWFSRYNEPYSPDLNSWAVLTAFQNAVHALEDAGAKDAAFAEAERLMLTAETSCYWYWTGQDVWDQQVTNAANKGLGLVKGALDALVAKGADTAGPTIFAPWITPENPGGKKWGPGCLEDAPKEGTVHTFVADVSGLARVDLVLRTASGETRLEMTDNGPYPCRTGATTTGSYFTAALPVGAGDVRYYIEAEDGRGNVARGALERVFLA